MSQPDHRAVQGSSAIPGRRTCRLTSALQYPLYAASALAANSFARSCFAAAFPLFGVQMYESKSSAPPISMKGRASTVGRATAWLMLIFAALRSLEHANPAGTDLGYQWATSLLAFLALAMAP